MKVELTSSDVAASLGVVAARLAQARDELCRLDGLIGDGDHGVAMADGFAAAAKAACALDLGGASLADVFNAAAKAFLNAVGASSGPLYATALMRAAKVAGSRTNLPMKEAPLLLVAMAEGVRARGQAAPGEKTMLDAWAPAAEAAERLSAQGAAVMVIFAAMREAATLGAEGTKAMSAMKGRAARLGERSVGHIDPGAASAALVVEALTTEWSRRAQGDASR